MESDSEISNEEISNEEINNKNTEKLMKKEYSYPEQNNADLQYEMYKKKEFYNYRIPERPEFKTYEEIKNYRDNIGCAHLNGKQTKPHPYQNLLTNFINPSTPYKGIIVMHGLGSGKTRTGVSIAENFIPQCQKYRTKIIILVSGPLQKENWKEEILASTGEKYLKYIDKSLLINREEKEKIDRNAMSLILQYYRFMSFKSFYKHVLGEKIIDKKVIGDSTKLKNVYRKDEDGKFERDLSADRIYNLNNTLLIVDEAHQVTGNAYGDAIKYIIDNSINLKCVFMTATPMKNLGHDIIELVNFLRPKDSLMERDKIFTQHKNYQMELKEGGEEYFKKMAMGYFSYVRGADPLTYATRADQGEIPEGLYFTKVTKCKMLPFQQKVYDDTIEDQEKEIKELEENDIEEDDKRDALDRKSEAISNFVFPGLSPDKKNIVGYHGREGINVVKNQLKENNSLLNRKLSNMVYGHENETEMIYLTSDGKSITGKIYKEENLKNFSTKFYQALVNINLLVEGKLGAQTTFVYSNLVKVGIEIFQEILLQNGYLEYQEDRQNYQINSDTRCYYCGLKYSDHGNIGRTFKKEMLSRENDSSDSSELSNFNINNSASHSDSEKENNKYKHISPHTFHPATFITVTGKSTDDTMDVIPEEKKRILTAVFNNIQNKEGKYIKLVLGSKVMNEGISLRYVGQVHILDVYFNLGKVDQAVGRAIRYCSHYHLMNEKNPYPIVKVFKYVVSLNDKLSTEEELYRKAEIKHICIKKIERYIKEIAIDCALNMGGNIFSEELVKYKDCEQWGKYKCPDTCDYMDCNYKCANVQLNAKYYDPTRKIYRKLQKDEIDDSTFNNELARNEIESTKEKIKDMFIIGYSYTIKDILDNIKNSYDEQSDLFDEFFVYKALDELIPITENDFNNFKDTIVDKHHRQGYLIYRGKYYIFQPFDQNENVPMYYRVNADKKIAMNLSLYNYLKMTDQLQQVVDIKSKKASDIDEISFYDFDATMEYYDNRNEYEYVGFIDKEINRKKNKNIDEIQDIFKLREKRAKILEKKRATGLPSLKGAVCVNAKSKGYLESVAKKLGIQPEKNITRTDICRKIEDKMLTMEKYGTDENKNKFTYVMIPVNHPSIPFPYNLQDRTSFLINDINNAIKINLDISHKSTKKTDGKEKGQLMYIITLKNIKKLKDDDIILIDNIVKKYKAVFDKKNGEIIVD
ncbi:DEXDc helicase [Bodo saltans virus]|uniref:DEXDc helicase n=1 Tax=Bodo saltans virus TaxID=2024608 RepID=A0A2H4UVK7_9VIRU|nr:DEXDc helicase [Bodo saltans virus]ATZ80950.1 DEXDc helicase [Bodo saltans virus]